MDLNVHKAYITMRCESALIFVPKPLPRTIAEGGMGAINNFVNAPILSQTITMKELLEAI